MNPCQVNKKMTEKNDDGNYCDMCKGNGKFLDKQCVYCNGNRRMEHGSPRIPQKPHMPVHCS